MTDRDKLIELCNEKINTMKFNNSDHWFDFVERIEKVADHLLANGVIVPPCKVGDIVYEIKVCTCGRSENVKKCEHPRKDAKRIGITPIYTKTKANGRVDQKCVKWFKRFYKKEDVFNFGKTVFLTREEAKKKLKELGK